MTDSLIVRGVFMLARALRRPPFVGDFHWIIPALCIKRTNSHPETTTGFR
jgi:1-acyl-sn-glycerol-3-phosphate acyltransferase